LLSEPKDKPGYKIYLFAKASEGKIIEFQSLSSESLNFKKPEESNIFVSTKKFKYYGTLQAKQK